MGSIRVVYDTNTIVSAYGFDGTPETAITIGFIDEVDIYVSKATLAEPDRVLQYDRLPFSEAEQAAIPAEFRDLTDATVLSPTVDLSVVDSDADDDRFVELAAAAAATNLVSGDEDLLALGTYNDTDICSPSAFVEMVPYDPSAGEGLGNG